MAVFRNTGRFFKNLAPVGALKRYDLVNFTLTDVGISLSAETGIHKQLVDILQAGALAVDIVFAFTAAVIPARNGDFRRIHAKCAG